MDVNRYIGIPWVAGGRSLDALDCWGLVMQIYADVFNFRLSDFLDQDERILFLEVDEPDDYCLVRAVSTTKKADHWGVYYKGKVINASQPTSTAPTFRQFVSRFPVIELYEVAIHEEG